MDSTGARASTKTSVYYPGKGDGWERRSPEEVGMDSRRLQKAIDFANDPAHAGYPRDLGKHLAASHGNKRYDDGKIIGYTKEHGPVTGVVVRHGYLAMEWGETERVDMTFSVAKSFLSTAASLAFQDGLIRSVHDRVSDYVDDGGFDSPHNSKITWDHMLRQTNEWDGALWGKHYSAGNTNDELREPLEPGSHWEYNDVRVNRLALALLRVFKRPLPQALKERVMDPIDASDTWQWHGYRNSWVTIDGKKMQSVSGGGHWGGGMWISARDQARFGYLCLRDGNWKGRQLVSPEWIKLARTPTKLLPTYGFMNWMLNTNRALIPSASEDSYFHVGAGANRIWVDPDHDLVVVLRWVALEHFARFAELVLKAVKG